MKEITLAVLLICVTNIAFCANEQYFQKGYIVTNSNDTIHGFIDRLSDGDLSKTVNFKKAEEESVTTYKSGQITAFGFDDGVNFELVHYTHPDPDYSKRMTEDRFAKRLLNADINLYKLRLSSYESDYVYVVRTVEGKYYTILQEENKWGNPTGKIKKSDIGLLTYLLQPCQSEVVTKTAYTDKNMIALLSQYSTCAKPSVEQHLSERGEKVLVKHIISTGYTGIFHHSESIQAGTVGFAWEFSRAYLSRDFKFTVGVDACYGSSVLIKVPLLAGFNLYSNSNQAFDLQLGMNLFWFDVCMGASYRFKHFIISANYGRTLVVEESVGTVTAKCGFYF